MRIEIPYAGASPRPMMILNVDGETVAALINGVESGSIAEKAGIKSGETLVFVNGHEIFDVLDYRFYIAESEIDIVIANESGQRTLTVKKDEYDDLGVEFDSYLIDKKQSCKNKCIFCFIDQMPSGMRETLYFKDDDSRLSFLMGNYITLTNLTEHDVERIIDMKISPIHVSVHTTNPELRVRMMANKHAGSSLSMLYRLAEHGIKLDCQLVLCSGINDGEELERSISDLLKFYPNVESIAVVPVGLTKHREGLFPLKPYDKDTAGQVIDIVESAAEKCFESFNDRVVYAADEFYLKAGRELPDESCYGDFLQLENGVGLTTLMKSEFIDALEYAEIPWNPSGVTVLTGVAAAPFLRALIDKAAGKCHNLRCEVIGISNSFFGETVDVAGLVTGGDVIKALKERSITGRVLIPDVMLRSEGDLFLDSVSVSDVEHETGVKIQAVECNGEAFLNAIFG